MTGAPFSPDWFSKPGDSLRSLMNRRGIEAIELARSLEGGMCVLRGLLDGSIAIDKPTARTLSEVVGGTTDFWVKRQENYEEALERAVTAASARAEEWLQQVPAPTSKSRGRQGEAKVREELRRRLVFFNVSNIRSWEARYGSLCAATRFRTSGSFSSSESAMLLWLRRGELEADLVTTQAWNPQKLQERLDKIRRLSRISQPARFLPKLKALCAEAGVALVVVKSPQGCHASGASRLVTADKAMILLSFRYRSDEQFWFTVFHEIGHLLLHGADTFVDVDETPDDEREREANEFASKCVVPDNRLSEFESLSDDKDSVVRFSVSVGIAAGLVVGQMQHRGMIGRNRLNSLKRRWTWDDIDPALVYPL